MESEPSGIRTRHMSGYLASRSILRAGRCRLATYRNMRPDWTVIMVLQCGKGAGGRTEEQPPAVICQPKTGNLRPWSAKFTSMIPRRKVPAREEKFFRQMR